MAFRVSFSDFIGIAGLVIAIVLVYLDKTDRLKGGSLIFFLIVAGGMSAYAAAGSSWVADAPEKLRLWRAAFLCGAVVALFFALWIWGRSSKTSNENAAESTKSERAHIHVTKFEWHAPSGDGGIASVKVIFVNDGKKPVTRLAQVSSMAYFLPEGDFSKQRAFEEEFLHKEPSLQESSSALVENQIPVGVDRSFVTTSPGWTPNAIEVFAQGNAVVYVAGTILYSDGVSTYKTKYCGFISRNGEMKFCGRHNEEP